MSKRKRVLVIGLGCLGVVILALLLFSAAANAPHGAAKIVVQSSKPTGSSINMTPVSITTTYASFEYPAAFTQTPTGGLMTHEVAGYTMVHHDVATWSLAIEILSIPTGNLSDNNSFQYRKVNPQTYAENQFAVNGQTVTEMTDTTYGGFSKVAFLVHGQYQAVISLYGDDPSGLNNLRLSLTMIEKTWHWND